MKTHPIKVDFKLTGLAFALLGFLFLGLKGADKSGASDIQDSSKKENLKGALSDVNAKESPLIYEQWKTFTTKDGLPSDKAFCVKADGDRVWVGTDQGLALYEDGNWTTYTTEDGLAHRGVLSIDISPVTGDVWIATMAGLNHFSAGKFETFTQFNSGLANDVIYNVTCVGKDVWVATGGGAGQYDTYTQQWEIFTEQNAPMHEPWTYGITSGDGKIFIAAWGGGVIEYTPETRQFRDYVDPDGEMEIDLFPDDGLVHDITTGVSYSEGVLWAATYFGLSRYDGTQWKGYFKEDSGMASNFINYLKANGSVIWLCTDDGLSGFDGTTWATYRMNENRKDGVIVITKGKDISKLKTATSISNNFIIGVDIQDDYIWVATAKGICRGKAQAGASIQSSMK